MKIERSKRRRIESKKSSMREVEPLTSVKIQCRKRKKISPSSSNPNPITPAFTRSKSRISFHQNRSGFSRPDPITRKRIPEMEAFLGMNCRTASRVLSSKHRIKRIFSPDVNSVPEEEDEDEEEEEEEGEETNEERKKLLKGFNASTVPTSIIDEVEKSATVKSDARFNGENVRNLKDEAIPGNGPLPKMKMGLNGCSNRKKVYKTPSSFSYRRLLPHLIDIAKDTSSVSRIELDAVTPRRSPKLEGDYLNRVDASVEEHIQTTPPDPGIFSKTEDCYGGKNHTFVGLPVGSEKRSSDTLKQSLDTINSTDSMNKTVINPCSRLRLFKNHRSLSYRRLLPFLMDISKSSSCSSKKPQQKSPQAILEEDRHPAPAASAKQDYVNNTTKENYEKRCSEDFIQNFPSSMVLQPASDSSSPGSNSILVSSIPESSTINNSSNVGPMSVNSVTLPDLGMSNGLPTEVIPQSQSKATKLQLDLGSKESSSVSEPCSSVNTKQCDSEEPCLVEKQRMCSSMGLELPNGNAESIELVDLKKHSSQIKASDALLSSNKKNFKGILKRNRRGCRGLCNCLDCASFRLHAERAFEFSRNQLHDAEEVASGLMKELANLRLLLEKSMAGNDSASTRTHSVLIKQACNKALETEALAKESLAELNNDLSVHCRIPVLLQPKVTFAYNI